jgi:hypothetical protein
MFQKLVNLIVRMTRDSNRVRDPSARMKEIGKAELRWGEIVTIVSYRVII